MKKQMKTVLTIMMIIIINILSISTVYAADESFTTTLTPNSQTVKQGETVEVIVKIGSFSNITKGVNTFEAILEYDENVLSLDEENGFEAQNRWDLPTYNSDNKKILTTKASFVTADENIMKIIFTVKEDATLGNTSIKIKEVAASDDETMYNGTEATATLEIIKSEPVQDPSDGDGEQTPSGGNERVNPPVQGTTPQTPQQGQVGNQQTTTDGTISKNELPKAGIQYGVFIMSVIVLSVSGYIFYKKYKNAI